MKVTLSSPRCVFAAPKTQVTEGWGVYFLPRLWRLPDRSFGVFINGGADHPFPTEEPAPDLCFLSHDGEKFSPVDTAFGFESFSGIDTPFLPLPDGTFLAVREKEGRIPVKAKPHKRFAAPNGDGECLIFRQGDLSEDEFCAERCIYTADGELLSSEDIRIELPERELILYGAVDENGKSKKHPILVKPHVFSAPYIRTPILLPDGTLLAVLTGQEPSVSDRFCGVAYLMASKDGGKSFTLRQKITGNAASFPFGLVGDGEEGSLARLPDGRLIYVSRTDMSCDHTVLGGTADTVLFFSDDDGYTWTEAKSIADGSVTPHAVALRNGILAVVYGRPGVHVIFSEDGGQSFSSPTSIIGRTLSEELLDGKSYMNAKYFDTPSYSNSFVEVLSDDSFFILYTDLRYDCGDGEKRKATLIRKVTVSRG